MLSMFLVMNMTIPNQYEETTYYPLLISSLPTTILLKHQMTIVHDV